MDPYLIPGTKTLRNLRGISDFHELREVGEAVSALRMAELLHGSVRLRGRWDMAHLQRVHRHIFGDVYDWAGQIRTIAMWKATDHHPLPRPEHADRIFSQLECDHHLRGLDRLAFITKLSQLQADLFALHPFREGNTRSTTMFVRLLGREAGWNVDWLQAKTAGVQVLLRASYEAPEHEAGRVLEPLFDSITSPLVGEPEAQSIPSTERARASQWDDEAQELHGRHVPGLADGDEATSPFRGVGRDAGIDMSD